MSYSTYHPRWQLALIVAFLPLLFVFFVLKDTVFSAFGFAAGYWTSTVRELSDGNFWRYLLFGRKYQ